MASLNTKANVVDIPDLKNKVLTVDSPAYFNILNNNKFPNKVLPSVRLFQWVFIKAVTAQVASTLKINENMTAKEKIQVQLIKKLIVSYLDVVKRNINDTVPKTIITFLVNKVLPFYLAFSEM